MDEGHQNVPNRSNCEREMKEPIVMAVGFPPKHIRWPSLQSGREGIHLKQKYALSAGRLLFNLSTAGRCIYLGAFEFLLRANKIKHD